MIGEDNPKINPPRGAQIIVPGSIQESAPPAENAVPTPTIAVEGSIAPPEGHVAPDPPDDDPTVEVPDPPDEPEDDAPERPRSHRRR